MSSSDPLVGHVLDGRYEILRKLARGGMATVYLASDRRLTRTVAIKVMHENLGEDAEFVSRFDREARAAARLSHPNVVSVFDQGIDNGRPYIVMEYVEGGTLRHLITREAPFEPARALDLLIPVIGAVAAAHEAGIIHRDLKPENVLISDRGQIKVADFGLARAVTAQTATQTGILIGTVSYIAPELVTHGRADTRCDVYALGVILFELLTGRKPHTGETPLQVAYSHVHNEVPAPSEQMTPSWRDSRNGIPPYLDALVVTAAARDPQVRYGDAQVMLAQATAARDAIAAAVMDDARLASRIRATTLDPDAQVTQQVLLNAVPDEVNHTRTMRFTPTTPAGPGQLPSADGMGYLDSPTTPPGAVSPTATAAQHQQRVRRRRGFVTFALVLALAATLGIGGWYLFIGRYTTTPAFENLTRAQAETLATESGLALSFDEDFSEDVPDGQVIRTNPAQGAPILHGGEVLAIVSKGPERFKVPTVAGLTSDKATEAVTEGNLTVGRVIEVYDDEVEAGVVISSDPKAGNKVKRDAPIDLTVSKGPAPVEVTDWTGKSFAEAKSHFVEEGLKVKKSKESYSEEVGEGDIIAQDPSSGELKRGDTISFEVSKGPELVAVPSVSYKSVDEAKAILEKAGFKVELKYSSQLLNLAAYTDPSRGTKVPKGSVVTIWVV